MAFQYVMRKLSETTIYAEPLPDVLGFALVDGFSIVRVWQFDNFKAADLVPFRHTFRNDSEEKGRTYDFSFRFTRKRDGRAKQSGYTMRKAVEISCVIRGKEQHVPIAFCYVHECNLQSWVMAAELFAANQGK